MPEETYDLGQGAVLGNQTLTGAGTVLLRLVEGGLATTETAGDSFEMG